MNTLTFPSLTRNQKTLILSLTALSLCFAYLFNKPSLVLLPSNALFEPLKTQSADTYIINAHITQHDATGLENYQINSERVNYYNRNKMINFDAPFLKYSKNNHITISAKKGTLSKTNTLNLYDNVILKNYNQPLTLKTSRLSINLKDKNASSDKPVTFDTPNSKIEAIGLDTNLETKTLILKNRVRGYYEP
jgi:LPS export ABC transporter protein LptC